jgi:hypothetical protein
MARAAGPHARVHHRAPPGRRPVSSSAAPGGGSGSVPAAAAAAAAVEQKKQLLKVTVNGHEVLVPEGSSIVDAAAAVGVTIPTCVIMRSSQRLGAGFLLYGAHTGAPARRLVVLLAACPCPLQGGESLHTRDLRQCNPTCHHWNQPCRAPAITPPCPRTPPHHQTLQASWPHDPWHMPRVHRRRQRPPEGRLQHACV